MKISYRWLQQYIECQIPVDELAHRLTMAGLEVEGQEEFSYHIPEDVVVGEILDVQQHYDASKLYVCQVHVGEDAPRTIVCGAPNTVSHVKVAVALPGVELPNGLNVREAKIRGVLSQGMICAEDELGISDDHSGILILPETAPIGVALSLEILGLEADDAVLEVGLTPNRGDCLSHFGIAREVATLLNLPLTPPPVDYPENGPEISSIASVSIESPELCDRYTASAITGVKIGPSPLWLKRRLQAVGVRSINNVVDVTNFVMMELGQPLHAFDLAMLEDRQIIVRRAQAGEQFTTLDDIERELDETVLMIADAKRDVAIGGVMGGQNSEVSDTTRDILLESAHFNPSNIRKTSKKLGLSTEASHRFERDVDLLGADIALRRATKLIVELAGGTVARSIIDELPSTYTPRQISLRYSRVERILGTFIEPEIIRNILSTLGFQLLETSVETVVVEVPSFRSDVEREIDLVEEVGRIYGYDRIPTGLPSGEIPQKIENTSRNIKNIVRKILLSQGLSEVVNYSFFDKRSLEKLGIDKKDPYDKVVTLKNPLTTEQGVLRTTTIPGLIGNLIFNRSNRVDNIRLFEIGRIFLTTDLPKSLPDEKTVVGGILTGSKMELGWTQSQKPIDFYDIKGILENTLQRLDISYEFRRADETSFLHPGESATILVKNEPAGLVGKLHPDVCEAFDIDEEYIYVFELFLDVLMKHASLQKTFCALPKFPAVHRDLAVIIPTLSIQAADIETVITEVGQPLLENVVLFDRYVGPQVGEGHIGLTYSLRYRSPEKTLTDNEVSEIHQRIIQQLQARLGIRLR